jgi:hypothetical protein
MGSIIWSHYTNHGYVAESINNVSKIAPELPQVTKDILRLDGKNSNVAKWQNNNWIVRSRFSSIFGRSPAEIALIKVKELDVKVRNVTGVHRKSKAYLLGKAGFAEC